MSAYPAPAIVPASLPIPTLVDESEDEEETLVRAEAQSALVPYQVSIGEVVDDIKELTKTMCASYTFALRQATAFQPNFFVAGEVSVPAYPPIPSTQGQNPWLVILTSNVSSVITGFTYSSWFESAFFAQRGGYRVALQQNTSSTAIKSWLAAGVGWNATGAGLSAWNFNTATTGSNNGYALFEGVNSDLTTPQASVGNGLYEMELPSVNPAFYRNAYSSGGTNIGVTSLARGPSLGMRVSAYTGNNTFTADIALPPVTVWFGTADDYSLAGFNYIPAVVLVA